MGKLAALTDKLAAAGVNILAALAWVEGETGHLIFVPDDPDEACRQIKPLVDTCDCEEVVHLKLPHKVGGLSKAGHKLADAGINIHLLYATAAGKESLLILRTSDNAKAATLV